MPDRRSTLLGLGAAMTAGVPLICARSLPDQSCIDPGAMYAALREQTHQTLRIGGGTIDVTFADGAAELAAVPRPWHRMSFERAKAVECTVKK
jgi:hypothetical protein